MMTGNSRQLSAGRDWRLYGNEYEGGQYAINSDSVIVLSTVLAF